MNINEKKIERTAWICFLFVSIPIIIIAFYNHPSADDYAYGRTLHFWIQENGYNILGIIKCAALFAYNYYFKWTGCYADSFTGALMPENFGCYWISAIIIYLLLVGGILYLFRVLFSGLGGKECCWIGTVSALFAIVAITQNWPSTVEALYWFDGAQSYMGYHAIYLWMCGVVFHYIFNEDRKKSIRDIVVACLLAFIVAGGNNVTSFMSVLTYVAFLGIVVLIRKKRGIIFPFIMSIVFFLVNYFAPGTTVRGGGSSNYTPVLLTIIKCFRWTIRQYVLDWMSLGIGLMLLFLTPILIKLVRKTIEKYHFQFPYPLLILIGSFCFLSAMSSPAFYILGESGPLRLRNLIYVNFVILVVLTYGYFLGWLAANHLDDSQTEYISEFYQRISWKYGVSLVILVMVWITAGTSQKYGTSIEAVKELLNGSVAQYHAQIMERYELYEDSSIEEVVVEPLRVKPELIYFDDITDDETNWKNVSIANYFGKRSVKLSEYDPDVDYD